jgi:hypothetical protein
MVEYIPYFAAFIMLLFGAAFYAAMTTFRKLTEEDYDRLPQISPAEKPSEKSPDDRNPS